MRLQFTGSRYPLKNRRIVFHKQSLKLRLIASVLTIGIQHLTVGTIAGSILLYTLYLTENIHNHIHRSHSL